MCNRCVLVKVLAVFSFFWLAAVDASICTHSTQESIHYSFLPGDVTDKGFQYRVNNSAVGEVQFYIHLSHPPTTTPSFQIAIFSDPNNAGDVELTNIDDWAGEDQVVLEQLSTGSYRLTVTFSTYYNFELAEGSCGPTELLGFNFNKAIKLNLSGLSLGDGHIQINAISKTSAAPDVCDRQTIYGSGDLVARTFTIEEPCSTTKRPTDVVFVLDRSGSMDASADPGSASLSSKLDVLENTIGTFFSIWKQTGLAGQPETNQFTANDKAGLVFIDEDSSAVNTAGGNFLITFGDDPDDNDDLDNLIFTATHQPDTTVGNRFTHIGDALQIALTGCIDPENDICAPQGGFDDSSSNYRHIILFTDGYEQYWDHPGAEIVVPADPNEAASLNSQRLPSYAVPIHTLGAGVAYDTAHSDLLQRIAADTQGKNRFTTDWESEAAELFLEQLVETFRTNTLGIIGSYKDSINQGSEPRDYKFQVNQSVERLVFVLLWHSPSPHGMLMMEVFPPGASSPTAIGIDTTKSYLNLKNIILPLEAGPNAHVGEWTLRVKEELSTGSMGFYAALLADEHKLEYRAGPVAASYATGEKIVLQARLMQDGNPLSNANVDARVTRPQSAFGTMLRVHQLSEEELTNNPAGHHSDSFPGNYERKLYRLAHDPRFAPLLKPVKEVEPVVLLDNGDKNNGDFVAGDGVYSATYNKTRLPGEYVFDFSMSGSAPGVGEFARAEKGRSLVRVDPDPGESEVVVSRIGETDDYLITVVPADQFGNFMGPGYPHKIQVSVSGDGTLDTEVRDPRENGSYQLKLSGVPQGTDPEISVTVSGKEIQKCPISSCLPDKYAIYVGLGGNSPQGSFDSVYDSDSGFRIGIEYRYMSRLSVEVEYGHEEFDHLTPLDLDRLSLNAKYYFVLGTFQLAVRGGVGVYNADPGDTDFGVNVGATAEYRITPRWSIDINTDYHNVFGSDPNIQFMNLHGGLRYRF